ncbi:copper-binding protein [Methylibium petroleiphilum]|uniref:copper-binding protein n=1 Tax=Methylibium petroleiphilum TaxID=105560 RepID=UPI001AD0D328|nr:copper-binding protein [Methylibium petroleiphilum]MBN9205936.1 copper-binding protein [Methylibium petroleiphilum]
MKTQLHTLIAAIAFAASAASLPALAANDHGSHGSHGAKAADAADAATEMTDGEIRKVDKENGKLTIKHAEIKSLDMPGMTMVFQVKDKAMLDKVQAGDKVKFKAASESGKFTVTELEAVK